MTRRRTSAHEVVCRASGGRHRRTCPPADSAASWIRRKAVPLASFKQATTVSTVRQRAACSQLHSASRTSRGLTHTDRSIANPKLASAGTYIEACGTTQTVVCVSLLLGVSDRQSNDEMTAAADQLVWLFPPEINSTTVPERQVIPSWLSNPAVGSLSVSTRGDELLTRRRRPASKSERLSAVFASNGETIGQSWSCSALVLRGVVALWGWPQVAE